MQAPCLILWVVSQDSRSRGSGWGLMGLCEVVLERSVGVVMEVQLEG